MVLEICVTFSRNAENTDHRKFGGSRIKLQVSIELINNFITLQIRTERKHNWERTKYCDQRPKRPNPLGFFVGIEFVSGKFRFDFNHVG